MKRKNTPENIDNTGFSASSTNTGRRLINDDGTPNLRKTGLPFWEQISLYHTLLRMHRVKFLLCLFLFYAGLNLFFASMYVLNGVEHLRGSEAVDEEVMGHFMQAFFFSSQTLTTVGYGHISPSGLGANIIASLESFIGILSFALVTGLLYGRFTRPKAYIKFSNKVLISPHKDRHAIMCRVVTYKNNHLTDVEAQMNVALHVRENGNMITRFYPLKLEIAKINSMALSWTLVHLIDEESVLYNKNFAEMKDEDIEILVFVKGFDDHFSNIVQQRTSYTVNMIVNGGRFLPMFKRADDGSATVLQLDKIDLYENVALPVNDSPINV